MLKFISLLMALFCFSCSSGKLEKTEDDACVTVDLVGYLESGKDNELSLSTLIDSLEYVPLQTPDDLPVDILLMVRMTNDNIYVLDRQQRLFRFDRQGHFQNLIGARGEGPTEYISAVDFEVDETKEAVYIFDIYRKKVKAYRMSGAFWKDIPVPEGVESIALVDDSCFIGYRPWYRAGDETDQCMFFGESAGEVGTISFGWKGRAREMKVDLFRMPDFSQLSSASRFRMPFESAIYALSQDYEVSKDVEFELGNHLLPIEVSMNNELYNKHLDAPYVFELKANRFEDFVYMSFFYQKKNRRVVYDISTGKFYTVFVGREPKGIDNDLDGGSTFWPLWFTKDKLIGVLPDDALEMKELMEYDNPVLQIGY
mgnify:FL=1